MCFICDRIKMINNGTNPYFVKELQTGYVVIGDNQHFKGYTLFLCKEHKTELFQLNHTKKIKFLEEMSIVAEAVSNAFGAEKIDGKSEENSWASMYLAKPKDKKEIGTGVFNGEMGTIIEIDEREKVVKIQFDDEKIAWYEYSDLDQIEHSYAITIHKAQRK